VWTRQFGDKAGTNVSVDKTHFVHKEQTRVYNAHFVDKAQTRVYNAHFVDKAQIRECGQDTVWG